MRWNEPFGGVLKGKPPVGWFKSWSFQFLFPENQQVPATIEVNQEKIRVNGTKLGRKSDPPDIFSPTLGFKTEKTAIRSANIGSLSAESDCLGPRLTRSTAGNRIGLYLLQRLACKPLGVWFFPLF